MASAIVAFNGWPGIAVGAPSSNVAAAGVPVPSRSAHRLGAVLSATPLVALVSSRTVTGRGRAAVRSIVRGRPRVGAPPVAGSNGTGAASAGGLASAQGGGCGACTNGSAPGPVAGVGKAFSNVTRAVGTVSKTVAQTVSTVGTSVGKQLTSVSGAAAGQLSGVSPPAGSAVNGVGSTVANTVTGVSNTVANSVSTLGNALGGGGR